MMKRFASDMAVSLARKVATVVMLIRVASTPSERRCFAITTPVARKRVGPVKAVVSANNASPVPSTPICVKTASVSLLNALRGDWGADVMQGPALLVFCVERGLSVSTREAIHRGPAETMAVAFKGGDVKKASASPANQDLKTAVATNSDCVKTASSVPPQRCVKVPSGLLAVFQRSSVATLHAWRALPPTMGA